MKRTLKHKEFPLSSTKRDIAMLKAAEEYCNNAMHRGEKVVSLQMVCGCNNNYVPVPVVQRFVSATASPFGHTITFLGN